MNHEFSKKCNAKKRNLYLCLLHHSTHKKKYFIVRKNVRTTRIIVFDYQRIFPLKLRYLYEIFFTTYLETDKNR